MNKGKILSFHLLASENKNIFYETSLKWQGRAREIAREISRDTARKIARDGWK